MGLIIYFMVECISKVPNKFLSIFLQKLWEFIKYGNELLFNFLFSGKSGTPTWPAFKMKVLNKKDYNLNGRSIFYWGTITFYMRGDGS